ncbi:MAG: hypothetical protein PF961_21815 [Planctomycetota bacterium]|jgi:hypothetical protein|nr:hypothetical protein [Planctomycetota bacterium]
MLRFTLLLAPILLCAAEAVPTPDLVKEKITVRPEGIYFNSQIYFNESGAVRHRDEDFNVRLAIDFNGLRVAGYRDLSIDTVTTDVGETLRLDSKPDAEERFDLDDDEGSIHVNLTPPSKPAATLSISGHMTILVSTGLETADLSPASDWIGKTVAVNGVEGGRFMLKSISDDEVAYSVNHALLNSLAEVRFATATGKELDTRGGGSWGDDQNREFEKRVKLPKNGTISLVMHQNPVAVPIPFTLEAIPLPGSEATDAGKVDAVLTPKPMGDAVTPAGTKGVVEVEQAPTSADGF